MRMVGPALASEDSCSRGGRMSGSRMLSSKSTWRMGYPAVMSRMTVLVIAVVAVAVAAPGVSLVCFALPNDGSEQRLWVSHD